MTLLGLPIAGQLVRAAPDCARRARRAVADSKGASPDIVSLFSSIPNAAGPVYSRGIASFRRIFRSSEAALVLLSVAMGLGAGLLMILQRAIAHGMQGLIYGLS